MAKKTDKTKTDNENIISLKKTKMKLKDKIESHRNQFIDMVCSVEMSIDSDEVNLEKWMEELINELKRTRNNKNRMYFIGNGASSSMSSHFATDFTKNGGISSFSCNEGTLLTCFGNDFGYENAYMQMMNYYMQQGDVLVAISSSGASKNIVNAINFVRQKFPDNVVITFTGFDANNYSRTNGSYNLYIPIKDYGMVESSHAYYLHMLLDFFIHQSTL